MRTSLVVAALSVLLAAPASAELKILKSFPKDGAKLELALFTKGDKKAGIVGIAAAKRDSYGLNPAQSVQFVALLKTVTKTESAKWRFVGAMTEVDTQSPSHLVVYAGPSVQFVLIDPSIGVNVFELSWDDFKAFQDGASELNGLLAAP